MIDRLALRLALWLKSEVPEHPYSVERLQFGFHLFLNTLFTLLAASALGVLFQNYRETMQVLFAFGLLRMISGGFHFKSAVICIVVSAGVAALLPTIVLSEASVFIINMVNLVGVIAFSPSGIEHQTRIPSKYFPYLKLASALLVSTNFVLHSHLLAITWFIQVISLIRVNKSETEGGEST